MPSFAQFAGDPDVAPARVLACQPQHEFAQLAADRRSAGTPMRIGPVVRNEPAMPAQERFRPHHECLPRTARQHPTERREQQPVARLEARPVRLPTQDRQRVARHEDLQLFRALAAPEQHDQLEQPADDDVHERQAQGRPPQDGLPTLPRHQQGASHSDRRDADRVCAPHLCHER